MTDTITIHEFANMIAGAAEQIKAHSALLSQLDSIAGDGDHGATMVRTMDCLQRSFSSASSQDFSAALHDAGWAVLSVDGGASTSLLGSFFMGMGDASAAKASSLDCAGFASLLTAGLQAVQKQTKAQPGDKTMMDALVPAVEVFSSAAMTGEGIGTAFTRAAEAASSGVSSTKGLISRHGRARLLGEKTRGSRDPGATSIALIFEGFSLGLKHLSNEAQRIPS